MSIISVREYDKLAQDANGNPIQAGLEPALAATVVNNPTSSTQLTLNVNTKYILISVTTTAAASFHMSKNNNPTALATTATLGYLAANSSLFFGVESGGRDASGSRTPAKIAFINDT